MKLSVTLCALLISSPLVAQTPSTYNLTVHVTESEIGYDCSGGHGCEHTQTLRVTVDRQQYELQAETLLSKGVIALGDYPARLSQDVHKPTNEFSRQYTIQFPDGSTRTFDVIGTGQ